MNWRAPQGQNIRRASLVMIVRSIILLMACSGAVLAQEQPARKATPPAIQDLGNQRYRIGAIEIDKARGMFKVPGQVLRDAPPLEFLVVTRGGHKAYEAVLEVNADAFEFNLACILIGLDASHASTSYHSDASLPVEGDLVEVKVSWADGDKMITVDGSDLLVLGEPPQRIKPGEWVYTGSIQLPDGQFLADISGTLVGFVHRAESIIQHSEGIGLGKYGSVAVNRKVAPPVGTQLELIISRAGGGG